MTSVALNYPARQEQAPAAEPRVRVVRGGKYALRKLKVLFQRVLMLLAAALAVGLIVSVVSSQARITELSGEIEAARNDLTAAKSTHDYLSSSMDSITSRSNTQEIAEGTLGLVKADQSQMTYIQLEDESVIEKTASDATKVFNGFRTAALSLIGNLDP